VVGGFAPAGFALDSAGEGAVEVSFIGAHEILGGAGGVCGDSFQLARFFLAVSGEERGVLIVEASEAFRRGPLFDFPEGGESEKFGEKVLAAGGAGEAGFVLDREAGVFLEDGFCEEAGALSKGAAFFEAGEAFGVAEGAGGGAALEDEAVGGGEGAEEFTRICAHFLREAAAGGGLDEAEVAAIGRYQPDRLARGTEADLFFRADGDDLRVASKAADEIEGDDFAIVAAGGEVEALAHDDDGP
jgi:hypothetical protein